jgi:hypothetical protein
LAYIRYHSFLGYLKCIGIFTQLLVRFDVSGAIQLIEINRKRFSMILFFGIDISFDFSSSRLRSQSGSELVNVVISYLYIVNIMN